MYNFSHSYHLILGGGGFTSNFYLLKANADNERGNNEYCETIKNEQKLTLEVPSLISGWGLFSKVL